VHHDTHDVLVLQVAGEKRWLLYDPLLELPLKHQRYSREVGEPGDPVLDLILEAGDTLYLPRGWLHEALTSERDSLHLTLGINSYTVRDALAGALAAAEDDVELRRTADADGELAEDLLERVGERLKPEDVAARMRERFLSSRRPILEGQLGQLRRLEALTLDTRLERRPTVIADLREDGQGLLLVFEGKRISFPLRVLEEVAFAVETREPFSARKLPGTLDEAGRLVLVRRLIREGFLYAPTSLIKAEI
jgi:hypothetical protein